MSPISAPASRILVVDDTPANLQTIAAILKEKGYRISVATNGRQALEVVEKVEPDLILLDVMMPGMDGPATLVRLRTDPATAHVPVVFVTARVQPREVLDYKNMGALDVVAKPFDPMTLPDQLRGIWEKYDG
jgi:CheY-like chemotaxis protein